MPSTISSYGSRQAWAHWPRLALRPPSDFAGQALAGVGDAQCAVDEDFQRHVGRWRR